MAVKDLRGISFPFRKGPEGFPQPNSGIDAVLDRVKALLMTGRGELPFGQAIGVDLHGYVFESLSPGMKAKIVQDVRAAIAQNEPAMKVLSVTVEEVRVGQGKAVVATLLWNIAGESGTTTVPIGTQGVGG